MRSCLLVSVCLWLIACAPAKENALLNHQTQSNWGKVLHQEPVLSPEQRKMQSYIQQVEQQWSLLQNLSGEQQKKALCLSSQLQFSSLEKTPEQAYVWHAHYDSDLAAYYKKALVLSLSENKKDSARESFFRKSYQQLVRKLRQEPNREVALYSDELFLIENLWWAADESLLGLRMTHQEYGSFVQLFLSLRFENEQGLELQLFVNKVLNSFDSLPSQFRIGIANFSSWKEQKKIDLTMWERWRAWLSPEPSDIIFVVPSAEAHFSIHGRLFQMPSLVSWPDLREFLLRGELPILDLQTNKIEKFYLQQSLAFPEGESSQAEHNSQISRFWSGSAYCK